MLVLGCAPSQPLSAGYRPTTSRRPVSENARPAPQAPQLKKIRNGHYRVRKPWTVELKGRRWVVPAGYTSNGITAPDRLKASMGDGVQFKETWAAVFHDWLFTQPGISRSQADGMFYDLLVAYGVSPQKAKLMYTTVAAYSLSKSFR